MLLNPSTKEADISINYFSSSILLNFYFRQISHFLMTLSTFIYLVLLYMNSFLPFNITGCLNA